MSDSLDYLPDHGGTPSKKCWEALLYGNILYLQVAIYVMQRIVGWKYQQKELYFSRGFAKQYRLDCVWKLMSHWSLSSVHFWYLSACLISFQHLIFIALKNNSSKMMEQEANSLKSTMEFASDPALKPMNRYKNVLPCKLQILQQFWRYLSRSLWYTFIF